MFKLIFFSNNLISIIAIGNSMRIITSIAIDIEKCKDQNTTRIYIYIYIYSVSTTRFKFAYWKSSKRRQLKESEIRCNNSTRYNQNVKMYMDLQLP